ncbi:GDSL-type esterase/lipase family protein [Candidatus Ferrigenium straubiae]|jgi:acyl-CoA thioesterase-1|uniref:arylesterase n=1 Tax=Candidatus Ferrigenium straubiae TaxID=2919506 RepID=UPI003F4AC840
MKNPFLKVILLVAALWLPLPAQAAKNILVFGDSLSAGYGIAVAESWPALLQEELARSHPEYRVVNASISGETTEGGRQRIAAALREHHPAIVIAELGANDGLRGYRIADIEANLGRIIEAARAARAKVLLVGMRLPPNYGEPYVAQFAKMYPRLAKKYRTRLLPFLFEGIAPQQFQADNLHPTKEAQPQLMRSVLKELKPLLR